MTMNNLGYNNIKQCKVDKSKITDNNIRYNNI
jgi:hypothetical protein